MLLLSSATSILATESPPGSTRYRHFETQTVLEHSARQPSIPALSPCVGSGHGGFVCINPVLTDKGCDVPHPLSNTVFLFAYQGRIFFSPFFLLLDSFPLEL